MPARTVADVLHIWQERHPRSRKQRHVLWPLPRREPLWSGPVWLHAWRGAGTPQPYRLGSCVDPPEPATALSRWLSSGARV